MVKMTSWDCQEGNNFQQIHPQVQYFHPIVWSAICKIIPWAKENFIRHMSLFIHVASKSAYVMTKSIYNYGLLYMSYAYFH